MKKTVKVSSIMSSNWYEDPSRRDAVHTDLKQLIYTTGCKHTLSMELKMIYSTQKTTITILVYFNSLALFAILASD